MYEDEELEVMTEETLADMAAWWEGCSDREDWDAGSDWSGDW